MTIAQAAVVGQTETKVRTPDIEFAVSIETHGRSRPRTGETVAAMSTESSPDGSQLSVVDVPVTQVVVSNGPTGTVPAAFGELFADEHVRLLRLAFLISGDHDQAEEAVAEAFARCYPRWRRGGVDNGPAYLRTAVVNELRRRGRRTTTLEKRLRATTPTAGEGQFDEAAAERDVLVRALQELPVQQRAAVVLRFYDDRSEAETAALLGVSAGAVKTHVHRGLIRLRSLLGSDE